MPTGELTEILGLKTLNPNWDECVYIDMLYYTSLYYNMIYTILGLRVINRDMEKRMETTIVPIFFPHFPYIALTPIFPLHDPVSWAFGGSPSRPC